MFMKREHFMSGLVDVLEKLCWGKEMLIFRDREVGCVTGDKVVYLCGEKRGEYRCIHSVINLVPRLFQKRFVYGLVEKGEAVEELDGSPRFCPVLGWHLGEIAL